MYIRAHTGLGDPLPAPSRTDWRRWMMPEPAAPPALVFRRIGPFAVNKSALTPALKQQVKQVVDFVRSRLDTAQAIGVIRVVGHTDASGTELHNRGLGNRRTEAVRDELRAQLRDVLSRVLIEVDESPGKSQPIGDNRTAKGQAANRRVDVYVAPPIPRADPWPKGKTINWTVTDPNPEKGKYGPWDDPLTLLGDRSGRQFLTDLCRRRFSRDTCGTLVDKAISGGCKAVEALLERAGATISAEQKQTLEQRCTAGADKRF